MKTSLQANSSAAMLKPTTLSLAVALLAGSVMTVPALAQDDGATNTLEEVVVMARKRQESIQDVPVAVTALTPMQLERGSIQRTTDLGRTEPW